MARPPRAWRRSSVNRSWYTQLGGKKVYLGPPEWPRSRAQQLIRRLVAQEEQRKHYRPQDGDYTARDILNLYLAALEKEGQGLGVWVRYLAPATRAFGRVNVPNLRPRHVSEWLDGEGWGPRVREQAVAAVRAAFAWAKVQGHLRNDPLSHLATPQRVPEPALSDRDLRTVYEEARDEEFRDLLAAMALTGCRPWEVYMLRADDVDLRRRVWWVRLTPRTTKANARRAVKLNALAVALTARVLAKNPAGVLFRNTHGEPWTRHAVALRMARIAAKLGRGPGAAAGGVQQLLETRPAKEGGVHPETVAALVGQDLAKVKRTLSRLPARPAG